MSDKIQKIEREIARAETTPSLDDVLGPAPTAIVKREGRTSRRFIELGRHIMLLRTIRGDKDRRGYPVAVFEMVVVESDTMSPGEQVAYVIVVRTDFDTIILGQHAKNLKLTVSELLKPPVDLNMLIDVECVSTITKKGMLLNRISMWRRK